MAITVTVPAAAIVTAVANVPTATLTSPSRHAPIRCTYETGPFGGDLGRSLFSWILMQITNVYPLRDGKFHWYIRRPNGRIVTQQDGVAYGQALHEFESPIKHTANQQDVYIHVGIQSGTEWNDTTNAGFSINRLGVQFKPAPNAPIKGHN